MNEKAGTLYCIGVGPGDPELMTRKAHRLLTACPVIAVPLSGGGKTMALDIVKGAVSLTGKTLLLLDFPMTADETVLREAHRQQAAAVAEKLDAGLDVALVTIGDVTVFSTLTYISDILIRQGYRATLIPGVTSFCACACALGESLTDMKTPLHIFPGSFSDIKTALSLDGTKVFMKSGRQMAAVRQAIVASGVPAKAVVDCGLATEAVYPSLADLPDDAGYFTTVIAGRKV